MRINVAQQLKGHIGESRSYTVEDTLAGDFPVKGEVKLVLTNRSILASGEFQTIIHEICSRCLEEFEQELDFRLEEEFFPAVNLHGEESVSADEKMEGFAIGEDNVLDLAEAFRQNIFLNLSRKPVCRPDCAGLCPECGCNLNNETCQCSRRQPDPRWSPLKGLLSEQAVESGREVV